MPRRKAPTKEDSALLPPYAQLPDAAIHVPATPQAFAAAHAFHSATETGNFPIANGLTVT